MSQPPLSIQIWHLFWRLSFVTLYKKLNLTITNEILPPYSSNTARISVFQHRQVLHVLFQTDVVLILTTVPILPLRYKIHFWSVTTYHIKLEYFLKLVNINYCFCIRKVHSSYMRPAELQLVNFFHFTQLPSFKSHIRLWTKSVLQRHLTFGSCEAYLNCNYTIIQIFEKMSILPGSSISITAWPEPSSVLLPLSYDIREISNARLKRNARK